MNKDSVTALIALIVLTITVASFALGYTVGKRQQLQDMRETYKTCLTSHYDAEAVSEETCAKALEATDTTFTCDNVTICRLEVR